MADSRFLRLLFILAIGMFLVVSGISCSTQTQSEDQNTEEGDDDDDTQPALYTYTKTVNLICSNNVTTVIFDIPFEITATTNEEIVEGTPVEITFTGIANFPAELLNLALGLFPSLTEVTLDNIKTTIAVRSGASGTDVVLGSSIATPADIPFPVVNDSTECLNAGYTPPCALEPMQFELNKVTGTFTPQTAGTNILVGLDESILPPPYPADPTNPWLVTDPPGPNGMRVKLVSVVQMGLECYMGTMNDNGTPGDAGDDFAETLSDDELLSIPVN